VSGEFPADQPVALRALAYLDEGGEDVTVGRADTDEYVVLPAPGAALLRQLGDGHTPAEAAAWYRREYGESVDIADFLATLDELGFIRENGENERAATPVRWSRLGRIVFSPVSAGCYLALLLAAVAVMSTSRSLVPTYHSLFFTSYFTILALVLFLGQFPLVLLHETAHALAGRRIGLRTRLSVSRRLYYFVFITAMDGLVAVPRRQRYLPILAGMMADLGVAAILILAAAATMHANGSLPEAGAIAMAFAYMTLLRVVWQFSFYLQTDIYYLITTVLGCVDLQGTARTIIRDRLRRLTGRSTVPTAPTPATAISLSPYPQDLAAARWYSWLLPAGYLISTAVLITALIPTAWHILSAVFGRLAGSGAQGGVGLLDSCGFLALNVIQFALIAVLLWRERRNRSGAGSPAQA
jgi:hypothetical protein